MAANRIDAEFSTNGRARRPAPPPAKPAKPARPTKADREARERNSRLRRRLAGAVGGIASGVLSLSVVHCTEAIGALTGSPWFLAALLAVGIDAGMIAAELSELIAAGDRTIKRLAWAYVSVAGGLSMLLNGFAFSTHCPAGMAWAGWSLGVVVPGLVLLLGRIAGHLAGEAGR